MERYRRLRHQLGAGISESNRDAPTIEESVLRDHGHGQSQTNAIFSPQASFVPFRTSQYTYFCPQSVRNSVQNSASPLYCDPPDCAIATSNRRCSVSAINDYFAESAQQNLWLLFRACSFQTRALSVENVVREFGGHDIHRL